MSDPERTEQQAPIGVAVRRTGLSPDVIRAWERRHAAIAPNRTESGRRLYSAEDLRRLELLKSLVDDGWAIGQLAHLPTSELEGLVGPRPVQAQRSRGERRVPVEPPDPYLVVDTVIDAIRRLDAHGVREQLERAAVHMSRVRLLEDVLGPLLAQIGDLCYRGELRTVHEHLASAEVRSFVGGMRGAFPGGTYAPRIVVTTPAGQIHEFGALMVAAMAGAEAWDVTYLGPDLPAEEIAHAVETKQAHAVALSITLAGRHAILHDELRRLRRTIGEDVHMIVGGRASQDSRPVLDEIGADRVDSLPHLRELLAAVSSRT